MTKKKPAKGLWKDEIERLETIRDELRVHAHLLKAEAKTEFEELEKKFQKLKRDAAMSPVTYAAEKAATDVSEATRLLVETIKDGMTRVRRSLEK